MEQVQRRDVIRMSALKAIQKIKQEKYTRSYQVNITPIGKNITHRALYDSFMKEVSKYKCVKAVILIAEFENTNHFHGYVFTKDICKFKNLYNKKHPFNFRLSHDEEIIWLHYITKHSNVKYT